MSQTSYVHLISSNLYVVIFVLMDPKCMWCAWTYAFCSRHCYHTALVKICYLKELKGNTQPKNPYPLGFSMGIDNNLKKNQEAMWFMAQLKEYVSTVLWRYDDLITCHDVLSVFVVKKLNVLPAIFEKYPKIISFHTFFYNTHVNWLKSCHLATLYHFL